MTFDLHHAPPLARQRPSSSVNEVEDVGGKLCERLMMVDLLHPSRKWVVWLWWDIIVCLLVLCCIY